MKQHPSPNFDERAGGIALSHIVLHYTGMKSGAEALARLCDPAAKVSAHYLIEDNGEVTQLIDESRRAWHAGVSFWQGQRDMNSASIGIELVNPGHEWGYRNFPAAQIDAAIAVIDGIVARHAMDARRCLLAHSDIAPARRYDPGELFPWQRLAERGFGLWPRTVQANEPQEKEATGLLAAIGYDVSDPRAALLAFQRRFHPENLTGEAYPETIMRLRSVRDLLTRG